MCGEVFRLVHQQIESFATFEQGVDVRNHDVLYSLNLVANSFDLLNN
jgi:hypothetical protein